MFYFLRICASLRKCKALCLFAVAIVIYIYFCLQLPPPNLQPCFKLILPHIEPEISSDEKDMFIAVVVNSRGNGDHNRKLRKTIRQTWGDSKTLGIATHPWRLFFALGIADNQYDHDTNLNEARHFNDVIIGNFNDTYINVVIKTFMGHYWAVTRLSCKYVLKTDDDVYVRVPTLITWLVKSGSPKRFYGGVISVYSSVPRQRRNKWYISYEQYSESTWPPWCHGAYHVLSTDVIPKYLNYTYRRRPFHSDDTYIGVASQDLGIKANQIPGFTIEHKHPARVRSEMELTTSIAVGHKLESWRMLKYHNFYRSHRLN